MTVPVWVLYGFAAWTIIHLLNHGGFLMVLLLVVTPNLSFLFLIEISFFILGAIYHGFRGGAGPVHWRVVE